MLPFKPSSIADAFMTPAFTIEESVYETPADVGINAFANQTVNVHFGEPLVSAWVAICRRSSLQRWGSGSDCLPDGDI
jgi:hypothetical protein